MPHPHSRHPSNRPRMAKIRPRSSNGWIMNFAREATASWPTSARRHVFLAGATGVSWHWHHSFGSNATTRLHGNSWRSHCTASTSGPATPSLVVWAASCRRTAWMPGIECSHRNLSATIPSWLSAVGSVESTATPCCLTSRILIGTGLLVPIRPTCTARRNRCSNTDGTIVIIRYPCGN